MAARMLLWLFVVVIVRGDDGGDDASVVVEQQMSCPSHSVGMLLKDGLSAVCDYQHPVAEYFFTISWKRPSHVVGLAGYMLYVRYGHSLSCTNFTAEETSWELHKQEGFEKGKDMFYAIVALFHGSGAQTITHVSLKEAGKCPIVSKIKPLPNELVAPGSAFSFRCIFMGDDPVPKPQVTWLFSPDRTNCLLKTVMLMRNTSDLRISFDNYEITILKATPEHVGCYILMVEYIEKRVRLKGYLGLHENPPNPKDGGVSALAETISLVLGSVVLVGFAVAAAMRVRCVRRKISLKEREIEETSKKVYVCHVTEDDEEAELIKFLGILKSFNVETIVELDSQTPQDTCIVEAVEENLMLSDKILILLSPSYMSWIATCRKCSGVKTVCRAHTELMFIRNMLHREHEELAKELVIISRDVKPRNFPAILVNRPHLTFPVRVVADPDVDLDDDMRRIICSLLEKEPERLRSSGGYHNL